jgi:hypothetical protein
MVSVAGVITPRLRLISSSFRFHPNVTLRCFITPTSDTTHKAGGLLRRVTVKGLIRLVQASRGSPPLFMRLDLS